ncbi:T7SS effector LXG polymorphic toxin [Cytobacillus kochii]|uniref:T7SS effector LXG polymorphic toxin n=1 Tax=Cytobacillus kochii TaxID=859143 RepID=UPI003612006F
MIRESFLEQDLSPSIRRTENITSDLTDEGNRTIQSVGDIVSLPRLDDNRLHQQAESANNKITQTVERLHHFDQQQTSKLEATAQDLSRLKSTINEIQTLYQNGKLSLSTYQSNELTNLLNNPVIGGMSLSQAYGPMALGMMPAYGPLSSMNFAFGGQPVKDVESNQSNLGWLSTGLDFVPGLSNIKAAIEATTGTDFITGREIGNLERAALVAAIFGGPLVKGGIKVVKWGGKLFNKFKNVLNPKKVKSVVDGIFSKVTQGFKALRNTAAELTKKMADIRIPLPVQNQSAVAGGISGGASRTLGEMASDVKDTFVRMSSSVRDGVGKGTVKDRPIYTKGFEIEPKYSSYEQRIKTTPVNKGKWSSERAESLFVSDKTGEIKKYLDEAGVDGVEYKNGMPDFSPFSKGEIKLENMTNDRKSNFSTADEELAKKWSTQEQKWTADDIADWREDNKYTWHELNDLETIQLVPSKINSVFKHLGGVGEYNIKVKLGE